MSNFVKPLPENFVDGKMPVFKRVMREVQVAFCPNCDTEMRYFRPDYYCENCQTILSFKEN